MSNDANEILRSSVNEILSRLEKDSNDLYAKSALCKQVADGLAHKVKNTEYAGHEQKLREIAKVLDQVQANSAEARHKSKELKKTW